MYFAVQTVLLKTEDSCVNQQTEARALVFSDSAITVALPICGSKEARGTRLCVRRFPRLPMWFALFFVTGVLFVTDLVDYVLAPQDLVRVHK